MAKLELNCRFDFKLHWLVVYLPSEKYESQLGLLFPIYGKKHLVGGFNHLEKYEFVNGKDYPI